MTILRPTRFRNVIVFGLFLISAIAFMDRTNISLAGPQIRTELGIDNVHLGWIISAFLIGYAVFQVPAGWLAYRLGPRVMLTLALVGWSIFTVATALISGSIPHALLVLLATRFLLGLGEAVVYPASNQVVAQWLPQPELGRANGWIFAGVGVGAGLSIPLLTFLNHSYGWRASFFFSASIGLLAAVAWFTLARDKPEEHPWVNEGERAYILATRPQGIRKTANAKTATASGLGRNLAILTVSYFMFGYVAWIFFGWFFIYLAEAHGLDLKANALASMLPFLAMTICCLAGGWVNDTLANRVGLRAGRCGVSVVGFFLAAVFLLLGAHVRAPLTASLVLGGGAGALYLAQSSFWSVSADLAGDRSGLISGVMNFGNQIGGALTASLTPLIAAHYGWDGAFDAAAVAALAGSVLWLFITPPSQTACNITPILQQPLGAIGTSD